MRWFGVLLGVIASAGVAPAFAQGVGQETVVQWFERFCLGEKPTLQNLTVRPAEAGWSPASFPTDFRFDKADVNLAWRGIVGDKPYELLIANVSKRKSNSLMCILRTPALEAAEVHKSAFDTTMRKIGLRAQEARPPHIYKYRGKTINGQSAQAELASALLVRQSDIHGRLPDTIYTKLSILY